ncbi:hypothetical protein Q4R69_19240, partial [Morganella morganii subsp. sibonii]
GPVILTTPAPEDPDFNDYILVTPVADILDMHDLSIVGVAYNKTKNELTFNIDDNSIIIFCDIFHWDLTSFEM